MAEATAMKAATEQEKTVLRSVIARGNNPEWKECPCGWFYAGPRCPDEACKAWKVANGKKRIKLYAHVDDDNEYEQGEKLGLEDEALSNFVRWGYEIEFGAEVDLETGEVTLLTVNGRKIAPAKG